MLFNVQYNLNYSYFRKIKRPNVLLDFHYNFHYSNLITIFRTVAGIYAVVTYQKVAKRTAVHITFVKFLHGCYAWRHLH